MIPDGFVQDLLSRVDIVDVVGRHVELKKGGANLMGLCPFHGEKSPSFSVSPSRQFYYCFGCHASGDAIKFLTEFSAMSFPDAVRELAQQVGLKVPEEDVDPIERERAAQARAHRTTLGDVMERAAAHYRGQLKAAPRAIDYLKRRGLSGAIAARFGLGYAAEGWHALASAFAGYDDPLLVESGLVIVQGEDGEDQKRYDRFRDRVMFPIRSVKGEVIGFGGRVLDTGEPKYLNSPETPLFSKGRELYGLFEAQKAIRERGFVLVVEGYMDVVALAQNGYANAVATLGTACTAEHVHKLFRFTDSVVFSFDGDAAGRRAAARALEAALPHADDLRSVRFLFLPAEHDPDSFVREAGAEAFEAAIAQAVPLSRQLLDQAGDSLDLTTAEGRARLIAQARPMWQLLPDGALRGQVLAELGARAHASADELAARWTGRAARSAPAPLARPARRRHTLRAPQPPDQIVRILLQRCEWWHELAPPAQHMLVTLPDWHAALFGWLERWLTEHGPLPWPGLRAEIDAESWADAARTLIDDAVLLAEPALDELHAAVAQTRTDLDRQQAMALLGRR